MNQAEILESKGLKIGDRVVVTGSWPDYDGWNNMWDRAMDETIGKEYEIIAANYDSEEYGYELSWSTVRWFPAQVLERPYTEEEKRIITFFKRVYTINPEAAAWLIQIAVDGTWRNYTQNSNLTGVIITDAAQWLSLCDIDAMLCWSSTPKQEVWADIHSTMYEDNT